MCSMAILLRLGFVAQHNDIESSEPVSLITLVSGSKRILALLPEELPTADITPNSLAA